MNIRLLIRDIISENLFNNTTAPTVSDPNASTEGWRHELDAIASKWQYSDHFEEKGFELKEIIMNIVSKYGVDKCLIYIKKFRDKHYSKTSKEYDMITDMMKAFINLNQYNPNNINEQTNLFSDDEWLNDYMSKEKDSEYYYSNIDNIKIALEKSNSPIGFVVKYPENPTEKELELQKLSKFLIDREMIYFTTEKYVDNIKTIDYFITGKGEEFLKKL